MFACPDFAKKQIIFVFSKDGERIAFSNDNMIVKNADGKIKFQCTCYRIFLVFVIGHTSITSAFIQESNKFGFFIALMTPGFRLYALLGATKDANTLLRKKQYAYEGLDLAKHIVKNKIANQQYELNSLRGKTENQTEAIEHLRGYRIKVDAVNSLSELMAYEGLASKVYFRNYFANIDWKGRCPRIKRDYINSSLDIGYTVLFTFMDAILSSFGFDTYCGVLHQQFYMRKSLVCDFVEPFRPMIDHAVKRGIGLRQIKVDDFLEHNGQFCLKWTESARYVKMFMVPILENKESIFVFVQAYYRAFMKGLSTKYFPVFDIGDQ